MQKTKTENIVSEINSNIFFKEFTFSKNDFKELNSNQKLEFADNVVWLDELFFIYQLKDRESNNDNDLKWFENKILKLAVKQIKKTLTYISTYPEILIENERKHILNIAEAKNIIPKKIIVYTPNINFPTNLRNKKFYKSSQIGLIHLFHSQDYRNICKYLVTPSEINQYLEFRERFYQFNPDISDSLTEQYFLGHFLETPDADHYNPNYIDNLNAKVIDSTEFNISFLIEKFEKNLIQFNSNEYYHIIKEIAKLNRTELLQFRIRFDLTIKKAKESELTIPYRIYVSRNDCSFIFIPLPMDKVEDRENIIFFLTGDNKYDLKAKKGIGVLVHKDRIDDSNFELIWTFIDEEWEYDVEMEEIIKDNSLLREVTFKKIDNPYK